MCHDDRPCDVDATKTNVTQKIKINASAAPSLKKRSVNVRGHFKCLILRIVEFTRLFSCCGASAHIVLRV